MESGGFVPSIIKGGRDALLGDQEFRGTVGIEPDAEILGTSSNTEKYSDIPKSENYNIISGENGPIMVDKERGAEKKYTV